MCILLHGFKGKERCSVDSAFKKFDGTKQHAEEICLGGLVGLSFALGFVIFARGK